MTRFGRRNNTVIANSCGCREVRVCGMQVPMLQSLSLRACLCFPPPLCEWCLPHSIQPAWIWQHLCFMWCKVVCGASQKIHIVPCYCKSTPACALLLLFGCLKAVKWPVFHASANDWVFLFHGCRYLGIQCMRLGGRRWEWSGSNFWALWDHINYSDPGEGFCLQLQGVLQLPGFESGDQILPLYPSVVFHRD